MPLAFMQEDFLVLDIITSTAQFVHPFLRTVGAAHAASY